MNTDGLCRCGKTHYVTHGEMCERQDCKKDAVHAFTCGLIMFHLCEEHFDDTERRWNIKTR